LYPPARSRPDHLLPQAASVVVFLLLWWAGLPARPVRTEVCAADGVLVRLLAPGCSVAWVVGLLLNAGMAVYLTVRLKLE
jgi:hypothetical protein